MARARNIKPGFFKNEDLAECSPWARLCFAGLWTLADREGRLEDRPKRIKGELFAFDSVEVDPLLNELQGRGFLVRYQNQDGMFIQISKFSAHQTPHYSEKASVIKPPAILDVAADEEGLTPSFVLESSEKVVPMKRVSQPPDSLIPDSLNPSTSQPDGFDEFWASWPKTDRKQDKKKCSDVWRKKKLSTSKAEIIAHVEALKRTRKWRDGYEPAPLTYLNGERWRDGMPEAETGDLLAAGDI